jgi:hypothetical protein
MARRKTVTLVDPQEFTRWRKRAAKFLRVGTSDNPRHARVMGDLADEVEEARTPGDVLAIDGLPEWVCLEADQLLEKVG